MALWLFISVYHHFIFLLLMILTTITTWPPPFPHTHTKYNVWEILFWFQWCKFIIKKTFWKGFNLGFKNILWESIPQSWLSVMHKQKIFLSPPMSIFLPRLLLSHYFCYVSYKVVVSIHIQDHLHLNRIQNTHVASVQNVF